jgi:hypothetical protein
MLGKLQAVGAIVNQPGFHDLASLTAVLDGEETTLERSPAQCEVQICPQKPNPSVQKRGQSSPG